MSGVMRTLKDGGCSLCNATDENVGKKRCHHVLDNASIEVRNDGSTKFVDITGTVDNESMTMSTKASEAKIKDFIASLSSGLSKKERDDILSVLREG